MNKLKFERRASEIGGGAGIRVGDCLLTACGIGMEILDIYVSNINYAHPEVMVTYRYDDNGRIGEEQVTLANFYNNLNS